MRALAAVLSLVILSSLGLEIHCPNLGFSPSSPAPSSVHQLKPWDVSVVMALGDSVTAGLAMNGTLDELRGFSWSIGGDPRASSMPNILGKFRAGSELIGPANGFHTIEAWGTEHRPAIDRLSAAQSGAESSEIYSQVGYLMETLGNLSVGLGRDLMKEWKVATIFIGTNDLCASCLPENVDSHSKQGYFSNLDKALERLKANFPKTFVNLVTLMGIQRLGELEATSEFCKTVHYFLDECACEFESFDGVYSGRAVVNQRRVEYNEALYKLAEKYTSPEDPTFAVVIQPFTQDFLIPDAEFLSTFDCFHPSMLGHEQLGIGLWNSMITPVADKKTLIYPVELKCASAESYLYTPYTVVSEII